MATTQLSNVELPPELFVPYMTEQTAQRSSLFNSGVIQQSEVFDERASEEGDQIVLPFFKDLGRGSLDSGFDSQAHDDNTDLTAAARSADKQRTVKNRRWNGWRGADLVETVIDEDPLQDIGDRVADYWASEIHLTALMMLNGLFKDSGPLGANNADHIVKVGAEDGTTDSEVTLAGSSDNGKPLLDALKTLGDAWGDVQAIAMHSKPYFDLVQANLIDFEPLGEQEIEIPRFFGREVIYDDTMPFTAGTDSTNPHDRYTTYFFGEGALAYGEGSPKVPQEIEREATKEGGRETFVSRRHFVLHPNGTSYEDTISGTTPTQSELETAGDWQLPFEHKNVPLAAVEHN